MSIKKEDINDVTGHRKRLKETFAKTPLGSFYDYELLELILFYVLPRRDTKSLAKRLVKHFGSVKGIFYADRIELLEIKGVGPEVINFLKAMEDFFSRIHMPSINEGTLLNNWNSVINYCTLTLGFKQQEFLRILYLNRKNLLIADELMQQGTIDKVAIYPREIVKNCITKSASAIIMVHNHPSGDIKPSNEDIIVTEKIAAALEVIGVALHDHVIVAQDKHYSFRANGMLN